MASFGHGFFGVDVQRTRRGMGRTKEWERVGREGKGKVGGGKFGHEGFCPI